MIVGFTKSVEFIIFGQKLMNFIIGQPEIFGITIINVNSFFVVAPLIAPPAAPSSQMLN